MGLDEILVQSVQQTIYQFIIFISAQSNQLSQHLHCKGSILQRGGRQNRTCKIWGGREEIRHLWPSRESGGPSPQKMLRI